MEKLTIKNCHRAAEVEKDGKTYQFEWRGEKTSSGLFRSTFAHVASSGEERLLIADNDKAMEGYVVTKWKYEENFEDMYNLAERAFSGTSFSPEERALYYIKAYEDTLQEDLKSLNEEFKADYIAKFREWVSTLFTKHSAIMSSAITGAANFPVARMSRANNAYDRAAEEFEKWRVSFKKRALRKIESDKSPEQRQSEELKALIHHINGCVATCVQIDKGENRYSNRTAFTNSIYGKIERMANNGHAETVKGALDYIRKIHESKEKIGLKKLLFTDRHKIWKLEEQCSKAIAAQEERENKEEEEIAFDGGKIVKNYDADRLQIYHDEKPSADVISALKHNGFRWSPYNGCWQRQLTSNASYAAARVFYPNDSDKRIELVHKIG